jgi:hypothetical protein
MQSVAPDPPSTLVHHEPGAGFMSKLASPCERRVKINSSERTLTVFEDAKSVSLAKVLLLDPEPSAPGREAQAVKIGFSALAEGPPRDWSNLRIEVWAPVLGDRAGQHKQHYFRARNYKEFLQCVRGGAARAAPLIAARAATLLTRSSFPLSLSLSQPPPPPCRWVTALAAL